MPVNWRVSMVPVALLLLVSTALTGCATSSSHGMKLTNSDRPDGKPRVLIFSAAAYYRHPENAIINGWLAKQAEDLGFTVGISESRQDLMPNRIKEYDILLLNNANQLDEVLGDKAMESVEAWFKEGRAIVAIHGGLVRQKNWPWLNQLAGCDFNSDSEFVTARVIVDPAAIDHPIVKGWGSTFEYTADWHNHDRSVTGLPGVQVLLRLDESTYEPVREYFQTRGGKPMGDDHPMTWIREWNGGRYFFTEIGHDVRSLDTPFGRQMIREALKWALEVE